MANIRTLLKNNTVLFTDSEYFNKDISGVKNLQEIKEMFNMQPDARIYKVAEYSNCIDYKMANSDYQFTLTII